MRAYNYRLLNVFALDGEPLSGNPLCVFEDGRGLSDAQMQALALQFNLSETTFIFPSDRASARVRIFTPSFEMPFAGHPTLGTAHTVRDLRLGGSELNLEMKAGVIPVSAQGNRWTLRSNAPTWHAPAASRAELAATLGLAEADLGEQALWVNTGSEQLVIPLRTPDAVARCDPDAHLLDRHARSSAGRSLAYVWAPAGPDEVAARFFFFKGNSIAEDPATGSACANLGGWYIATGASLPLARIVRQGDLAGRPSRLDLQVSAAREIHVTGLVVELGHGSVRL